MTPEIAVSLATFVVVFLLLSSLARAKPTGVDRDPEVDRARDLIRTKIDEHAGILAQRYREACAQHAGSDRMPGGFAREIEGFIGNVLLRELDLEHPDLGSAVREVVTLERERVYELVFARVQAT